jgi:hypothetical protein
MKDGLPLPQAVLFGGFPIMVSRHVCLQRGI